MNDFNWMFAAALLGPLTVMIAVYCFGLLQEERREGTNDLRKGRS